MVCEGCGNAEARNIKILILDGGKHESCEKCGSNVKPVFWTDAAGDRISVNQDKLGSYSYAIDAPITSKRQLSEHLKRNGLVQN